MLFVRSARTPESAAIYRAAWKGLEPFYGIMSRERMHDFDGERNRAREYFAGRDKPMLVVAFDPRAPDHDLLGADVVQAEAGHPGRGLALLEREGDGNGAGP